MVRCMRVDSELPPFLWGKLMMAASYICNQIPHSALNMEKSYKKLYGKDADFSHLQIIGARAFVHIRNPNKLGHKLWEEMVCGFSKIESNSYRIWNPKTRRVVESRNVVFIETPPNRLPAARRLSPQQDRPTISVTTHSTTCYGNCGTTPPLWISASTRLTER